MDNGAPAPLYSWPLTSRKRRRDPLHLKILGMRERVTILIFRENLKLFTVSGNQGWPLFHQPGGRQVGSIRRPLSSTNRCQAPRLAAGFGRRTKEACESPLDLDLKKTSCVRVTNASEKSGCHQTRHEGRRVMRKDRLALQHPSVHEKWGRRLPFATRLCWPDINRRRDPPDDRSRRARFKPGEEGAAWAESRTSSCKSRARGCAFGRELDRGRERDREKAGVRTVGIVHGAEGKRRASRARVLTQRTCTCRLGKIWPGGRTPWARFLG